MRREDPEAVPMPGLWNLVPLEYPTPSTEDTIPRSMNILEEANALVNGDRQKDYGHALDNLSTVAGFWEVFLETPITAEQVAVMLGLLKVARLKNGHKRDSIVDWAGYAAVLEQVLDERGRREMMQSE